MPSVFVFLLCGFVCVCVGWRFVHIWERFQGPAGPWLHQQWASSPQSPWAHGHRGVPDCLWQVLLPPNIGHKLDFGLVWNQPLSLSYFFLHRHQYVGFIRQNGSDGGLTTCLSQLLADIITPLVYIQFPFSGFHLLKHAKDPVSKTMPAILFLEEAST